MPFAFPPNGAQPPRGCWITKVDNNGACHSISFHGDHTVSPCSDTARFIAEHLQAGTNCCVSAGVLCQRSGKLPTQHKYQSRLIICCSSQRAGMWSKFTYNGLMWACCSSLCQRRSWWWSFFARHKYCLLQFPLKTIISKRSLSCFVQATVQNSKITNALLSETKKTQQMFTSEKLEPLIWIKSYLKDLLSFKVNGSFLN